MIKNLRLFLLGMVAMIAGSTMAQTVFDFDTNGSTLFGLPGESSNNNTDGDITADVTATKDTYTITVTPSGGKTANRIWNASPKFRMYGGSLTVATTGDNIKSILFTLASQSSKAKWNEGNTASTGTIDATEKTVVKWSGDAKEIVFNIAGNTQISTITVSTEGDDVTPDPDPDPQPVEVVDATCAQILAGTDGVTYRVTGACTEIKQSTYGNWMLKDNTGEVYIYGTLDAEGQSKNFASLGIEVGDTVTVVGQRKTYNETVELVDVTVEKVIKGQGGEEPQPVEVETEGEGTLASPFTAADAIKVATALGKGNTSNADYYVKGVITEVKDNFSAQFGNATFYIGADEEAEETFYCYRVLYLENKKWAEGQTKVEVGDEVIICGRLMNYNDTPETAASKAYVYSLNGVTKNEGGEEPEPQTTPDTITVAKALEIGTALEGGKTTDKEYVISGYVVDEPTWTPYKDKDTQEIKNYNLKFLMNDAAGDTDNALLVYNAWNLENTYFPTIDENLTVGTAVTLQGKIQKYVKDETETIELVRAHFLKIGSISQGIDAVSAAAGRQASVFNLQGQRIQTPAKGLFIRDGKKFFVK